MIQHDGDGRVRWVQALQGGAGDIDPAEIMTRLDRTTIAVVIESEDASDLATQTTTLTAINLLARLFRRLILVAPAGNVVHPQLPFVAGSLGLSLASFARRVHADVNVTLKSRVPDGAVALYVGASGVISDCQAVYCSGSGWLARVSRSPLAPTATAGDSSNPIGPLIAAALGAAEVFKIVFADVLLQAAPADDVRFSALTYRADREDPGPALGDVTLPESVLVGAGSIGSAFLWGLAHVRAVRGRLVIADHDHLETHNPDRAILVLDDTASRGLPKPEWARDVVQAYIPYLDIAPFQGAIREYVDTLPPDYAVPLAISAVDSVESRRDIQDMLPHGIVNASTGATRMEVSRHDFGGHGPCLYCMYLPEVLERAPINLWMARTGFPQKDVAEMMFPESARRLNASNLRGIEAHNNLRPGTLNTFAGRSLPELLADALWYSQALVPLTNGHALITTAFVSALAGFLLLAEALKEAVPAFSAYRLKSVYEQDLLGIPNGFVYPGKRDETGCCLCWSPLRQELYRGKYGDANRS